MMKKLLMTLPVVALLGCSTIPDGVSTDQNKCLVFNNKENSPTPDMPISIAPTYLSQYETAFILNKIRNDLNGVVCITAKRAGLVGNDLNPTSIFVNGSYLASLTFGPNFTCFRGDTNKSYTIQLRQRLAEDYLKIDVTPSISPGVIVFNYERGIFFPHKTLLSAQHSTLSYEYIEHARYGVKLSCLKDGGTSTGAIVGMASLGGAGAVAGPILGIAVTIGAVSTLGSSGKVNDTSPTLIDKIIPYFN